MNRYLTRYTVVALGAISLSIGAFLLKEAHVSAVAHQLATQDAPLKRFLKIDVEVEPWTQQEADCSCSDDVEKNKLATTSEKEPEEMLCYQPSPAERMGMAARSVSL